MKNRIRVARGTSTQRNNLNSTENFPVGVPFFETDTNKLYIGTGNIKLENLQPINAGSSTTANSAVFAEPSDDINSIAYKLNNLDQRLQDLGFSSATIENLPSYVSGMVYRAGKLVCGYYIIDSTVDPYTLATNTSGTNRWGKIPDGYYGQTTTSVGNFQKLGDVHCDYYASNLKVYYTPSTALLRMNITTGTITLNPEGLFHGFNFYRASNTTTTWTQDNGMSTDVPTTSGVWRFGRIYPVYFFYELV